MSIYGPQKLVHHLPLIQAIGRGETVSPVHVLPTPSDLCSHSCNFCSYRWEGNASNQLFHVIDEKTGEKNHNPPRFIPFAKCAEIIDDCAEMGVKAIHVTGGGEPTVHRDHHAILHRVIDRGLDLGLVTHGALLTPVVIDTLTAAHWVRVSIDAGYPATYSSIRRVGEDQYARAMGNVRLLRNARDRMGGRVVIGISFVVTAENWREVAIAARNAREAGADNFRISAVFQPGMSDYFTAFIENANLLCAEARQEQREGFAVYDLFAGRIGDLAQGSPDYKFCGYQHLTTYIAGDQNVYRCCGTSYNERGMLGSISDRRFKDFWASEQIQRTLRDFDARGCDRCAFNGQNRFINYALEKAPLHANFV